jgi:5-methylcytosine-specific restriction endonuclease McrA
MNWDNHGKYWEVDHVIPRSSFNLYDEKERKQCFHYTNLQPLTKKANRVKSNKI